MTDASFDWVSIAAGDLQAAIDPKGAQLSLLRDAGRDLLWDGDPAVWAGRAPLLFPIVGSLAGGRYRLGTTSYALPRHGFARGKPFCIVERSPAAATFRLTDDATTREIYPFSFELAVRFAISPTKLEVTACVTNRSPTAMPASFGFHPGFRRPLPYGAPRSDHALEFEREETAPIRRIDGNGLLIPELQPTPVSKRRLTLDDDLFERDVMIFDRLDSRSVLYGVPGGRRLKISFPDAAYLGVWSKPGANFVCIEPWHGVTDPQDFRGTLPEKPGIVVLESGGRLETVMTVEL